MVRDEQTDISGGPARVNLTEKPTDKRLSTFLQQQNVRNGKGPHVTFSPAWCLLLSRRKMVRVTKSRTGQQMPGGKVRLTPH